MKHGSKGNIKDWESSQLKAKIESHFNRVKYGNPLIGPFKPDSSSINLMSNDYLCLGDNEQIKEAIKNSITYSKSAPLMSAVYLNSASPQAKIEKALAKFSDFEDAILCQSGYVANVGLLEVVLDSEKPVYIDKFAHHSFMQGCLAAKVTPYVFNHNNLIHLKELIEIHGSGHILVDSIYSSIGSLCDLESVCNLADHYGCSVIVDESHSLGVFGKSGKGLVYHLGLSKRVEFITASLSKAFAGRAGLILGSKRNCETIRYNSSPAIFSSSLLTYEIAGLSKALKIIKNANKKRKKLFKSARLIREGFKEIGFQIDHSRAYIISIISGPEKNAIILRDEFEKRGIYGAVFCSPATPKNSTLIRFSINANISELEIKKILLAAKDAKIDYDLKIENI